MSIKELVEQYLVLRTKKDKLEEELKIINQDFDKLRLETLPNALDEAGIRTATFEGIGRVSLTADLYVSCPTENKSELYDWLRSHGYDGLVVDYVHPSSLKGWVKERIEGAESIPEIVKVSPFTRASVTKVN